MTVNEVLDLFVKNKLDYNHIVKIMWYPLIWLYDNFTFFNTEFNIVSELLFINNFLLSGYDTEWGGITYMIWIWLCSPNS